MATSYTHSTGSRLMRRGRNHRGRPSINLGPPIALRLYSDILASLDHWIENQPEPKPKRTEAIRELLREALKNH
jgi:hypothetical protein